MQNHNRLQQPLSSIAGVCLTSSQLFVNFPEADHWRAHPEDIEVSEVAQGVSVGATVRVRPSIVDLRSA
jgi:hypothetical protein